MIARPSRMDGDSPMLRLTRCRDIQNMFENAHMHSGPSRASIARHLETIDKSAKFKLAKQHLLHRKHAVKTQLRAYRMWQKIEAKRTCDRTRGERHFAACMEGWERRFTPLLPSRDYDCDAGILLFDMDMKYHNEAANALECSKKMREVRCQESYKPPNAPTKKLPDVRVLTCEQAADEIEANASL